MSVRIGEAKQPGSARHRKNPGCFSLVILTGALLALLVTRRK